MDVQDCGVSSKVVCPARGHVCYHAASHPLGALWAVQVPTRLSALESLMGLSAAAALALSVRCPVVIGLQPSVMRERFEGLCGTLGITHEQVRRQ
jgi:hypothetical protein